MAFATWLLFNRNELNLGGTNGLTDFKTLLGFSLHDPDNVSAVLYVLTALSLVVSFVLCRWLVRSKMGFVLTAIRDQEQRLRFLGYPVAHYKIFVFAVAAALAGLAGALYVPQVGIITPSQIGVLPSLEVVVWVATGGRGTLIGALLGAVGINAARSLLTAHYPGMVADHSRRPVCRGGAHCFRTVWSGRRARSGTVYAVCADGRQCGRRLHDPIGDRPGCV